METRPKIKLQLTTTDKLFEFVGWFAVVLLWIMIIKNYSSLPETIPIHFNGSGHVDRFGNKIAILVLPLLATILYSGLTYLNQFPHIFNYPARITTENAISQYRGATRMIRYLKLGMVILFSVLTFKTIQTTAGKSEGLGVWFLPLTLILFTIPLIIFIVNSTKSNRDSKKQ